MSREWDENPLVVASRHAQKRKKRPLTLDAFFTRYEVVGCGLLLHDYDHVLRATIVATERLGGGRIRLRLRSVRKAAKRKGHDLLGPFERGRNMVRVVNVRTFTVENLGDGMFHFSAPRRKTYGFVLPDRHRMFVAASQKYGPYVKTPPQGMLSLVSNG